MVLPFFESWLAGPGAIGAPGGPASGGRGLNAVIA